MTLCLTLARRRDATPDRNKRRLRASQRVYGRTVPRRHSDIRGSTQDAPDRRRRGSREQDQADSERHRRRYPRDNDFAHLRSLPYDQGSRQGNRARPIRQLWHHQRHGRYDKRCQRTGRRGADDHAGGGRGPKGGCLPATDATRTAPLCGGRDRWL